MTNENICPRCGSPFTCGLQAGEAKCWCAELPPMAPPDPGAAACFCPACLRALADAQRPRLPPAP